MFDILQLTRFKVYKYLFTLHINQYPASWATWEFYPHFSQCGMINLSHLGTSLGFWSASGESVPLGAIGRRWNFSVQRKRYHGRWGDDRSDRFNSLDAFGYWLPIEALRGGCRQTCFSIYRGSISLHLLKPCRPVVGVWLTRHTRPWSPLSGICTKCQPRFFSITIHLGQPWLDTLVLLVFYVLLSMVIYGHSEAKKKHVVFFGEVSKIHHAWYFLLVCLLGVGMLDTLDSPCSCLMRFTMFLFDATGPATILRLHLRWFGANTLRGPALRLGNSGVLGLK